MSELSENILRLRAEGKTYNEIEAELGCSKGTISYHLGVGQKAKSLGRQRETRGAIRKYLRDLKHNTPCSDCGERYPYWIMDFDHLEDKKFGLGKFPASTVNMDIVKAEVDKCEIVCSNCHRNRTYVRSLTGITDSDRPLLEEMEVL